MHCDVELTKLAKEDFKQLPKEIKQECLDMLKNLQKNLNLGQNLGNNGIRDLSDCYKLYFHDAEYRIIYQKEKNKISIHGISINNNNNNNIAKVVGIGQRSNYEIYDKVAERLNRFINK